MKKKGRHFGPPARRRKPTGVRHSPSEMPRGVRGLAWFLADQWPRLLEVSTDRATLGRDHAAWLVQAEKNYTSLRDVGVQIRKVLVDVDELTAWCAANKLPVDADSRPAFVATLLRTGRARLVD